MERSNKKYVSILYELRIISYHEQVDFIMNEEYKKNAFQKTTPGRMIISMIVAQENTMELKMRLIRHSPGNILRIRKTQGTRDVRSWFENSKQLLTSGFQFRLFRIGIEHDEVSERVLRNENWQCGNRELYRSWDWSSHFEAPQRY